MYQIVQDCRLPSRRADRSIVGLVDALRLSILRNRLCCRVDKARCPMSGTRHGGRARRIHQGSRDAAQI